MAYDKFLEINIGDTVAIGHEERVRCEMRLDAFETPAGHRFFARID